MDDASHDSHGSTAPEEDRAEDTAKDTAEDTAGRTVRDAAGVRLHAEGFGLDGPHGRVFSGIGFDAPPGSLVALEGPSGSGRTCLLLALTGRMKATAGHATVDGLRLPRQLAAVRRISAPAAVPGITDLEPALSAAEHVRERALLQRRFDGSLRALFRPRKERTAAARARTSAALEAAGLDLDALPKGPRTRVRDLERLEALRLSVALALIGGPRLLAVDDVDFKLPDSERDQAWALLRSLAASGLTVLAVCSEAPDDAVRVRTGTRHEEPQRPPAQRPNPEGTNREEAADALAEAGRA